MIRGTGGHKDQRDLMFIYTAFFNRHFGGLDCQITGIHRFRYGPLFDPGPRAYPFITGFYDLSQVIVRYAF